ncbi:ABC transporter ATP-binding protein/permease [Microbacterium sp.]|uniref:ABC transporter ATP-binding protein/permease n=1 Tax=Microbacterium sp. TaxID=51671 RepID=UPI003222161B
MTDALLELDGVTKSYLDDAGQIRALDDVTFSISAGEFVAIVGPSGSGKSTLLNILGLLDTATEGTYRLNGIDVSRLAGREADRLRSRAIGFVFQSSHLLPLRSAAENAALGLGVQGLPLREQTARVGSALDRLGLSHRAAMSARLLSGGEKQRVAIARAIAAEPALILADEPTGALDSENSARIITHLTELNRQGATVVIITHDPVVAASADRVIRLADGRVTDDTVARSPTERGLAMPLSVAPASIARRGRSGQMLADVCEAISTHSGAPARAMVLLLAFLLGVGGLVLSLGLNQSAAAQVAERVATAALDEVVMAVDDELADRPDTIARVAALEGVSSVGRRWNTAAQDARITLLAPGLFRDQPVFQGPVVLADAGYVDAMQLTVAPASAPDLLVSAWGAEAAILGTDAAAALGVAGAAPGRSIWVDGSPVDVVGIVTAGGRDPLAANTVFLSPRMRDRLHTQPLELVVRTKSGYPAPVAEALPAAVSPDKPARVKVAPVADLRNLQRGVADDLGALIGLIAVVMLVLASLSAATAMYLSVRSRRTEVALRRALGASKASVWRMFAFEGIAIGLAGGIAGVAAGMTALVVVCAARGWTPVLDGSLIVLGLAAGVVSGGVSALYPATVAARAQPAEAIRAD